ncbi:hypothetical protein MA20_45880 [Bradyrhizobium japonicum]|uniref:Uncharacterized protein n=1 Tax=Bradyrhizobium japonicum TaxID=375 RepID=A0A0A3XFH3_BRAJP|nr:hypothetical protein MA20_45880 [Bradyrhizobium japonicum]
MLAQKMNSEAFEFERKAFVVFYARHRDAHRPGIVQLRLPKVARWIGRSSLNPRLNRYLQEDQRDVYDESGCNEDQ